MFKILFAPNSSTHTKRNFNSLRVWGPLYTTTNYERIHRTNKHKGNKIFCKNFSMIQKNCFITLRGLVEQTKNTMIIITQREEKKKLVLL